MAHCTGGLKKFKLTSFSYVILNDDFLNKTKVVNISNQTETKIYFSDAKEAINIVHGCHFAYFYSKFCEALRCSRVLVIILVHGEQKYTIQIIKIVHQVFCSHFYHLIP